MTLDGKVVFVTGAARGLGRAIALRLAQAGADLVLTDICEDLPQVPYPMGTSEQLEHTCEMCRRTGAAVLSDRVDIRSDEAVGGALTQTIARFGRLDGLINNAAIVAPAGRPIYDMELAEWQVLLNVNLTGAWNVCRLGARAMLPQRSGSIVNIASTAGIVGYRYFTGYVATKHGLIGMTRAAALDLAPFSIRVNALCPGSVRDDAETEGIMLSAIANSLGVPDENGFETFAKSQPTNRLVEPDAVASAAAFLISSESAGMTGSIVTVDGGYTAR